MSSDREEDRRSVPAAIGQLRESLVLSARDREAAQAVAAGLRDAKAANTRRAYEAAWQRFEEWTSAAISHAHAAAGIAKADNPARHPVVAQARAAVVLADGGLRRSEAVALTWGRRRMVGGRHAGRRLVAKAPSRAERKHFPKNDFHLDLAEGSCTCPARQVTRAIVPTGKRTDRTGRVYRLQAFQFDGAVCWICPLRSQCIAAKGRQGRRVLIHPQEALLQKARALQQSADYDQYRKRRVVAEHRLARLVQLGIRQSRYFGRVKTKFQLYLAATVANLTLVLGKIGLSDSTGGGVEGQCCGQFGRCPARTTMVPDFVRLGFTAEIPLPNQGFPARFLESLPVPSGRSLSAWKGLFPPGKPDARNLLAVIIALTIPTSETISISHAALPWPFSLVGGFWSNRFTRSRWRG